MIKSLTNFKTVVRLLSVVFCLLFWVFFSQSIAGNDDKTTKVAKAAVHFSRHHTGNVLVEIKAIEKKNIELYIFDAEGSLVKKIASSNKKTDNLLAMENGQYIYQCFYKDAQLKTGKLFINQNNVNYD